MESEEGKIVEELMNLYSNCGLYVRMYAKLRLHLLALSHIINFLPKNGIIIDLGCGYGLLANYLSLRLKSARIIGLDLNPKRIKIAQETVKSRKNIEFLLKDVTLEVPSCSGVILSDFLHHLSVNTQNYLLRNIFNKLDRGGVLVILEINPSEKPICKYWLSCISDVILYPFSEKCHYRQPNEMQKMLSQIGFTTKVITNQKIPIFSRILYFCRKT